MFGIGAGCGCLYSILDTHLLYAAGYRALVHNLSHTATILLHVQIGLAALGVALAVHALFMRLDFSLGYLLHLVHLMLLKLCLLLQCPLDLGLPSHLV